MQSMIRAYSLTILGAAAMLVLPLRAETMDRPGGFKIGQRMTLRPYVGLSYTLDSNVAARENAKGGYSWVVNPGMNFDYRGENWALNGGGFYRYSDHSKKAIEDDNHSYGQNLIFKWANSEPNARGWTLMISESYQRRNNTDDMLNSEGRGYSRDYDQFQIAGALQRRLTDKWHADVNASYYYLQYDNQRDKEHWQQMYGWDRLTLGSEVGYAHTKWTDFILAANYQWYNQDNNVYRGNSAANMNYANLSSDSDAMSIYGGIASRATERISYRALVGWTKFKYADGDSNSDGVTYTVSGNWKISDTWNTMFLANSYFQPSEYEYGSSIRVDSISWGIAHSMIRGRLTSTLDFAYRRETRDYSTTSRSDYDVDTLTTRAGFNYQINRFFTLFSYLEYQFRNYNGSSGSAYNYDYDRLRWTTGIRLTY